MYLVRQEKSETVPARSVGGIAGAVFERMYAVWLRAKMRGDAQRQMKVVETLSLGGKKQLVLVQCGGERYLVGTGAESVETMVRVEGSGSVSRGDGSGWNVGDAG